MNANSIGKGTTLRYGLLIFLAVLALGLPQAVSMPLLDRDEPRFAEASREMAQSGDFVVPTFNGAPRYAKPPLIYWCQVTAFTCFGENALAARLPSLLATAGTAWLLFMAGSMAGEISTGLIAALAYAFCLQTVQQGRVATADALLVFFMTLTVLAGARLLTLAFQKETSRRRWNFWGAILTLGLAGGFFAKGPEAFLPFLVLIFCARRAGARVLMALNAIFLLGLLLVALWGIPALIESHGEYFHEGIGHDVIDRSTSGFQGHGASSFGGYLISLPFYLLMFWLSALPWSPLLALRARKLFQGWKPDAIETYLLLNIALIFAVFSLMVTKLPHYTLPAFPLIALLFARRWTAAGLSSGLPIRLGWSFAVGFALLATGLGIYSAETNFTPSPVGELVRESRGWLAPETKFALVDFQEPNAIWEMRHALRADGDSIVGKDVFSYLQKPGPRAVVLSSQLWQTLAPGADPAWKIRCARGWNAAKLGSLDLTLVVKTGKSP